MISSVVESHNNNKKPRKTRYAHTNFKQNGEESWIINYTKTKTLKNNKNIKQQQQEQKTTTTTEKYGLTRPLQWLIYKVILNIQISIDVNN